ncbi:MAG TPA: biosynthetic arginine decarboxylase [Planctomycetia bacterium]|nr:biosynthetic arginine decarboxylase [Planctomycetia bacterium]
MPPTGPLEPWTIGKAEDLYAIRNWGKGFFRINAEGRVSVHPDRDPNRGLDLYELVQTIRERGFHPPLLFRFPGILESRFRDLSTSFSDAMREANYKGRYRCVFPIKVNQQRHFVQDVVSLGAKFGYGVEAGSKPEVLAVLAMADDEQTPIVCNGFKDEEYLETVVLAQKLGKNIIPIIEKFSELGSLIEIGARHGVRPRLGVRFKLATRGSGKWQESSGQGSKFGLDVAELLKVLEVLEEHQLADRLKLLHFHMGSQITNIRNIKEAVNEAARVYVELSTAGAGLEMLDVGGGLGIDYDGSQTNYGSSMNYTLDEYARDVVFGVQTVCDRAGVAHPTIITESGRAVAAFNSVLVFNVLGNAEVPNGQIPPPQRRSEMPVPIANLYDTLGELSSKNILEMFHDAVKNRDDALNLFNLGYMSLAQRSLAERLFWNICREIKRAAAKHELVHEDLECLEPMLADTYFCNYSVFQSMPDSWAVDQLFPIMPIHRLSERPERRGTLADMTCDSDGKVDRFIDARDVKPVLELHQLEPNADYYLGAFLVGAYQEILGDLHNLFGDTHAVHVSLDDDGKPVIDCIVEGDTVREVLSYVQFQPEELAQRLKRQVQAAQDADRVTPEEAKQLMAFYEAGLDGYTYLE